MAASFERARVALDRTPPLSSTVERVLQRCGSGADLLLESVVNSLQPTNPLVMFSAARLNGQRDSQDWGLMCRPLLTELQQGGARCARCSPLGRLQIQSVAQSGSSMEDFMPCMFKGGVLTSSSDVDYMLQLGPVLWGETDAVCGGAQKAGAESGAAQSPTGAETGQQDIEPVPRLHAVPAETPGFVLLYQVKQKQCMHPDEHLFSADSVREVIRQCCQAREGFSKVTSSGPASSFPEQPTVKAGMKYDGSDIVPCLRADWWPSDEFFQRSRAHDWPPAAVRNDIRQFGIHLVPVGAKGSSTELQEWRLSFSRPEVVATWHLIPPQRNSLVTLKACKTALGPDGKPIKSYYIKTALFWLCQDCDVKQWSSIKQGVHMIIDYLEKAIDDRYLGCFFWSEINLFRQSSSAELAAMRHTLNLLRRNMIRLLAHELSSNIEDELAPFILREPSQQLAERQLRVCIVRKLVLDVVYQGILWTTSQIRHGHFLLIQTYLRSSAKAELASVLHQDFKQKLFLALTVAPADVMVRCRLTSLDDVMFSWDAAPLVELLTPEDQQMILGDPAAVHAWLKDQNRLPTGLSSPRALTDLLLNPSLLIEALRESVPYKWACWKRVVQDFQDTKPPAVRLMSFDDARRQELQMLSCGCTLAVFERLPRQGARSARDQYKQFVEKVGLFLDDPQTRAEFDRLSRRLPDPWRLRQFVFTDSQ